MKQNSLIVVLWVFSICQISGIPLSPESFTEKEDETFQDYSNFVSHGKKIIGIGRNYRWKESDLATALKVPEAPIIFFKPTSSYITNGTKIVLPSELGTVYNEIELGIVIGKKSKSVSESEALNSVAGYFLALDLTAKDFLKKSLAKGLPWSIGKGFDTACPVGEFIPKNQILKPDNLQLSCFVNGKQTQSANTRDMIFSVSKLIAYISKYITLEPYDTILTGTPDGLGPIYPGDEIKGYLGNISSITFQVDENKDEKD